MVDHQGVNIPSRLECRDVEVVKLLVSAAAVSIVLQGDGMRTYLLAIT